MSYTAMWPVVLSPSARAAASTTMACSMACFCTMMSEYLPVNSAPTCTQISLPSFVSFRVLLPFSL